jgi:hypothetical protein
MATKTINLSSFPEGYYMSWFVTTQAAFQVSAKLYDDSTTYFDASRQSRDINPPLSQGAKTIKGSNLKLFLEEKSSDNLKTSINNYSITTDDGTIVGYGCDIAVEDQTDNDYNDVCATIVAWKSRG